MSDSSIMIGRPRPSPWYGIDVRDGHAMTMWSPSPAKLFICCRCSPFAEGQQQRHRHGAPDDAEGSQEGAQLLAPDVPEQLTEEGTEADHHASHPIQD